MELTPYLNFDGNCREAFNFYAQTLHGKVLGMMTWADSPMADQMPPESSALIMHAHLEVAGGQLMGCDSTPQYPYPGVKGARVTLSVDSPEAAEAAFSALSEGAEVSMPITETFWAQRFGMLTDRFGVPWNINCNKEGMP